MGADHEFHPMRTEFHRMAYTRRVRFSKSEIKQPLGLWICNAAAHKV